MTSSKHSDKTAHDVHPRMRKKPLDLVLFGATGFTGSLAAKYLAEQHERLVTGQGLRWGIAGRSRQKLEALREELAAIEPGLKDLTLLVADVTNEDSLAEMAKRAEVVCSTVGPYSKYGSALVEACVEQRSDYCDLTGEVHWVWRMIQAHHERAVKLGVRIVHCCGFDSIPSDLGVYLLEKTARETYNQPCEMVNMYVMGAKGGFSGGTASSMVETIEAAGKDRQVRRVLKDPFSLAAKAPVSRPKQREQTGVRYAEDLGSWTGPFIMAAVNERVVRRSNMLLDHRYGEGLRYAEAQALGDGRGGMVKAAGLTALVTGGMGAMLFGPTRSLLEKFVLPDAGEGPSERQMEKGFFDIKLLGHLLREDIKEDVSVRVKLDRDPGYKGTALMLSEAACCLALQGRELPSPGGVLTPASAMGDALIGRLREAGMVLEAKVPERKGQG